MVCRKNGEILMTRYPSDEVVSCDPQRKEIHDLQNLGLSDYADCYVESLALLDELKEENEKENVETAHSATFAISSPNALIRQA
ncbi:hypothetical protein NC653_026095 [Populus alba x Populus x berolinensis]|nr:hypothetical protein NC653_026095 [Populus alba x Populus x berolinensis]